MENFSNESANSKKSYSDRYIDLLVDHKFVLFFISCVLIGIAAYFGSSAFKDLRQGGFFPANAESAIARTLMAENLNYPDYSLMVQVQSMQPTSLNATSFEFREYYRELAQTLAQHAPVTELINYYDYPFQSRMISGDKSKVLLFGTMAGDMTNKELQSLVSNSPLRAYVGGTYPYSNEMTDEALTGVQTAEFGSLPVVIVLLILVQGGLVVGLLPLYVAMMGVLWSLALLLAFNKAFRISSIAATIVTMFGLGLAIDYSLFIISRFRLLRKQFPNEHVKNILSETFLTAGKTVLISALTVFVALIGGLFFEEFFLSSISFAVMLSAALSAIGANSFLYSLLAILDHHILDGSIPERVYEMPRRLAAWLFPKSVLLPPLEMTDSRDVGEKQIRIEEKRDDSDEQRDNICSVFGISRDFDRPGSIDLEQPRDCPQDLPGSDEEQVTAFERNRFWFALGDLVLSHSWLVTIGGLVFLLSLSVYFLRTTKYGNTDADNLPITSKVRAVYDDFRSLEYPLYGRSNHYVYLQTNPSFSVSSSVFLQAIQEFQNGVTAEIGAHSIANIYSMINIGNVNLTFSDYLDLYNVPTTSLTPQYQYYREAVVYPLGLTNLQNETYIQFSTFCHQYDGDCEDIVHTLRSLLRSEDYFYHPVTGEDLLVERLVTGDTALSIDLSASLLKNLPRWLLVQVVAIFTILLFMTRSLVLPLKAVLLSVLSLGAVFGLISLVFQSPNPTIHHLFGFVPTGYFTGSYLIFIFSVAFGLSVDYEVFLLSRLLENYHLWTNHQIELSMKRALEESGAIITSAAVMLGITTFAFIGCQVYFVKIIGVGIAFAVVIDATMIRMLLVPAMINLFGEYNFYVPDWLGKIIDWVAIYEISSVAILSKDKKENAAKPRGDTCDTSGEITTITTTQSLKTSDPETKSV